MAIGDVFSQPAPSAAADHHRRMDRASARTHAAAAKYSHFISRGGCANHLGSIGQLRVRDRSRILSYTKSGATLTFRPHWAALGG
jgi:hypothetical protein